MSVESKLSPSGQAGETLMTAAQVRAHFGNISHMSLWRWSNDAAMAFPPPVKIRNRNFWRRADIAAWVEGRRQNDQAEAA